MRLRTHGLIYGLTDPRDSLVYYVGQSIQGIKRAGTHTTPAALQLDKTPKANWIRGVLSTGVDPGRVVLEDNIPITELDAAEQRWVDMWRQRNGKLTNVDPRDRAKHFKNRTLSDQHRRRLSEHALERYKDPEERRKLSELFKGRTFSDETRARMSAGQRKRMQNAVQRRKLDDARLVAISKAGPWPKERRLRLARAKGARPFQDQFGRQYESVRGAAELLGIDSSSISKNLKGLLTQTKGYVFTYLAPLRVTAEVR